MVAFARVRACHDAERRSVEADRISSSMQWAELCVPRSWAGKAREGKAVCLFSQLGRKAELDGIGVSTVQ